MAVVASLAGILVIAISIVSFVCWIMTLIKIFKDSIGFGILGIVTCGIFAFIYGWVKTKEYDNKKVMLIWSIAIGASIILQVIAGGLAGAAAASIQIPQQ